MREKVRVRMLEHWEEVLPDLITTSARDLQFILAAKTFEERVAEGNHDVTLLLNYAWSLDQAGLSIPLTPDRFMEDIISAINFSYSEDFTEYCARFARYIPQVSVDTLVEQQAANA